MSTVLQINPFEFFVDASGTALDDGYIWIGEPNKYPPSFPVQIFYDEALTIPASMPLRTSNGYVVRNGSPTFLYVNGNYSVLVQDKNSQQVYYVPDFLLIGNDSAVSETDFLALKNGLANAIDPTKGASFVGYKGRTVYSRLSDLPTVYDFGAIGDGIADDSNAFQAAADAGDYFVPSGNFLIKKTILVPDDRKIFGLGHKSKIIVNSTFVPTNMPWAGGILPVIFGNKLIETSGAGARIEIEGIYMDSSANSGGVHAVHMRNTQYCRVTGCTFRGGADGTAFTMSSKYEVTNNFAFDTNNCCYDQWEGSTEGVVANNVGIVTLGYGMLLTGDTSLNTPSTSANVSFTGNTIIGNGTVNSSVGIWLQSGSNLTSNCYSCRATGNYVRGFQVGIRATGGGAHSITGNSVSDCPAGGLVFSAEVIGNAAQNCSATGNVLLNCGDAASAPIVVQSGAANNSITGNTVGAHLSPYAIILDSTSSSNSVSGNALITGSTGFLSNLGIGNFCSNTATGLYMDGTLTPTLVSSGGGTPTYTAQYLSWQEIGNRVHFNLRIAISALGTLGAGDITIAGLPRLAKNDSVNNISVMSGAYNNLNAALATPPLARVLPNTLTVTLYKWAAGSSTAKLTLADIAATSEFNITGSYVANT